METRFGVGEHIFVGKVLFLGEAFRVGKLVLFVGKLFVGGFCCYWGCFCLLGNSVPVWILFVGKLAFFVGKLRCCPLGDLLSCWGIIGYGEIRGDKPYVKKG